jgi:hypothetical protein
MNLEPAGTALRSFRPTSEFLNGLLGKKQTERRSPGGFAFLNRRYSELLLTPRELVYNLESQLLDHLVYITEIRLA